MKIDRQIKGQTRELLIALALISVILALISVIAFNLLPFMKKVVSHISNEAALVSDVQHFGPEGAMMLIALQALQIVTVVFPSIAIQILAGLAFGVWKGLLICLAGYLLGNAMIFLLMRQIVKLHVFVQPERPRRKAKPKAWDFSFVLESDNAMALAFFLFLIPGIPNGILPYLFSRSKITLTRYLACILVAATPTILLSSTAGASLAAGNYQMVALIFSLLIGFTVLVFLFRNRLLHWLKK